MNSQPCILALASEFKGADFIREIKQQGCKVIVIARERFKDHPWPHDFIDQFHTMPDLRIQPDLTNAIAYLNRENHIDRIVALDDFDVEHAADVREHLRMPGMGHSQARLFRDKLAMRVKARESQLPEPDFVAIQHYPSIHDFTQRHPAPWIFKPRTLAGSEGIEKFYDAQSLWQHIHGLGDQQSHYLLEQFLPGDVFHVDSLSWNGEVCFALASQYGAPPLAMLQGQGIFSTRVLPRDSDASQQLLALNQQLLSAMGRDYGPTHSEFIRTEDGQFHFLETSARVAGGNIERVIQAASGLSVWQEAAIMELAVLRGESYQLPLVQEHYAGLIACPARPGQADINHFGEPEIRHRFHSDGFVSLVVAAQEQSRIETLLADYGQRLTQ